MSSAGRSLRKGAACTIVLAHNSRKPQGSKPGETCGQVDVGPASVATSRIVWAAVHADTTTLRHTLGRAMYPYMVTNHSAVTAHCCFEVDVCGK
jgi:hypothetical protein